MSDRVVAVKLKCADILPSRLATRVTINCDPASEIKLSALAPQACVRSEQQVKMVTLHSSNLDTPMSPLGLGRAKTYFSPKNRTQPVAVQVDTTL